MHNDRPAPPANELKIYIYDTINVMFLCLSFVRGRINKFRQDANPAGQHEYFRVNLCVLNYVLKNIYNLLYSVRTGVTRRDFHAHS